MGCRQSEHILLGMKEDGIGIVTDKNYDKMVPDSVKEKVNAAIEAVASGEIVVPTAIGDESNAVVELRESMKP